MTHEETIKRIQELTGGMALEEGCRVEVIFFESEEKDRNANCSKFSEVGIITDTDNEYLDVDSNIFGDILVKDIVNGWLGEDYEQIHCKILGKPITLAVIFQAIYATMNSLTRDDWEKQEKSHTLIDFYVTPDGGVVEPLWNLSKDNFNDQSEETKTFISNLLKIYENNKKYN